MKYLSFILYFCSILRVYSQWNYLGLGGTQASDLTIYEDTIYASTSDGIYKKYVLSTDTVWQACGMQGNNVVQTLAANYSTFICLVEVGSSKTNLIYRSTDGGSTFSLMNTSVSYSTSYNFLDHIAHPGDNYDTLYFLHHRLKTYNGGTTWDTINDLDYVNRFIKVNPLDHSRLLIGGETMIFSPYLQMSTDYGYSWTRLPNMDSYFSGDNSVHDMVFNRDDWFAVGEGVIAKTSDGGNKWDQLLNTWSYPPQWGLYIFDIEFSPADKNRIYATGDGYETHRVPLHYSSDYGVTWDTLSYDSGVRPNILALAVMNVAGIDRIFLGGAGIYLYENKFTGFDAEPCDSYSCRLSGNYPNPFNPATTISFSIGRYSYVSLRIYDLLGREVETLVSENLHAGNHTRLWNAAGLPGGIYFCCLRAGKHTETKKLLLLK